MANTFLIYGANGYTGELITRFAAERGLKPILAGRNEAKISDLAGKYGFEHRAFSLDDTAKLDAALQEVDMVLHCAGPFSITSLPMVKACLRNRKHYTDITGEISVFETCAAMDKKAQEAGVMIMPGVGFDVVPSDSLAVHLKNRLPSATHLSLAFYGMGRLSHGTAATMTMNVGNGGAIRKDGKITPVPAAWKTREIDFGEVTKTGVTIPWGDVATAYYSTGIPNIEVFTIVPASNLKMLKMSRYIGWLLATGPLQRYLQGKIPAGGPSDAERAKGGTLLWGEASDADGNKVESRLQGPEGYTITAIAALNIAEKILAGNFAPGYQTPAKAYGANLILEIEGTARQDV
ncbi:MAG TPA: saccharopine dehydrogenase NADP-binding domain-containing protein [Pyrinomonadaceae bacterium]|nr:saccharopine dehydrogenase NADP-binding domain-containing protein [Chloracidobacterium sp.]MBP9935036.1 saccharopine dehydrogenase NADP-binding domain-containing protein [Pyrinomonadaceae bacterium]MBK9436659.1 saccharopine dehydrogenase NADP-binding domain-containing protein [Chloracidobacterium sp.]MBL0241647.1 saccharopine dehydrogenase NADP-binding domain-containing protein [Chloracidobacterium sp.]HQX54853.1 saccharopine dehydrogenase NADP-binding domain-containing protein [Pyrinomonada